MSIENIDNSEVLQPEPEPIEKKPKIKPLTIHERKFCRLFAGGEARRVAYKTAFPHRAHWCISALDPEICKLLKDPRIAQEVERQREELAAKYFMKKEYKRASLKRIFEDEAVAIKDRLRAMELDAKIGGDLAPTKVEQTGEMNINHNIAPEVVQALDELFQ